MVPSRLRRYSVGSLGPDDREREITVAVQAVQPLFVQPVARCQVEGAAAEGHGPGTGHREKGFFRCADRHEALATAGVGQQGMKFGVHLTVSVTEMTAADGASLFVLDQQHIEIHKRHLPGREVQHVTPFFLAGAGGPEPEIVIVGNGLGQLVQQGGQLVALPGQVIPHDADLIVHPGGVQFGETIGDFGTDGHDDQNQRQHGQGHGTQQDLPAKIHGVASPGSGSTDVPRPASRGVPS